MTTTNSYPDQVTLVEVGPRDGLQNESVDLDTATKITFINQLMETGLSAIEVSSFVRPDAVPQLADAEEVFAGIQRNNGIRYLALVPNMHGLDRALSAKVSEVSIFIAATESFSQKNINCSIEESLQLYTPVIERARTAGLSVRAYISCVLGCPYEGPVNPETVARLAEQLYGLGCEEISLGDTIGIGTPLAAREMVRVVATHVPTECLALHFHDTRGQALANILACLDLGVNVFDASVAGLGGCPYAPGAAGNVATEDLVYMLHGMGINTGVDLQRLIEVGQFISDKIGRVNHSRVGLIAGVSST